MHLDRPPNIAFEYAKSLETFAVTNKYGEMTVGRVNATIREIDRSSSNWRVPPEDSHQGEECEARRLREPYCTGGRIAPPSLPVREESYGSISRVSLNHYTSGPVIVVC